MHVPITLFLRQRASPAPLATRNDALAGVAARHLGKLAFKCRRRTQDTRTSRMQTVGFDKRGQPDEDG